MGSKNIFVYSIEHASLVWNASSWLWEKSDSLKSKIPKKSWYGCINTLYDWWNFIKYSGTTKANFWFSLTRENQSCFIQEQITINRLYSRINWSNFSLVSSFFWEKDSASISWSFTKRKKTAPFSTSFIFSWANVSGFMVKLQIYVRKSKNIVRYFTLLSILDMEYTFVLV